MELQWWRLLLDARGVCVAVASAECGDAARLLVLPAAVYPVHKTWTELVLLSRMICGEKVLEFQLGDYWPAYLAKLAADLETTRAEGTSVLLWDTAGQLRLIGYAASLGGAAPWCDLHQRHAQVQTALMALTLPPMD